MDKLEKLADRLQASIDFATENNEDFDASSWNYQEGVLLNHNEAKLIVELVKKLTIPDVSNQKQLLTTFRTWWWGNREKVTDITNNDLDRYFGG